ncbi:ABC transporter substrate-binding protein [Lentzea sp. BCCO 10_0856]|uniref:ABC transporter substrate-binding protein n=1 Tax=Lentzea miocenica TaxID=3095431 RepID=A0ABU4T7K5_9PSEU|nr:ABC transporter substrate-binding protein [Lentzea sp. BCCO 10_0856]MDX8034136.1 ABC transporter substrate-binding protein [Lentzea sp. BCCO 10_0856]
MSSSEPRRGGTLRLYGPGSMDHVDPACAYYALGHQIIRLYARQLFTYPAVRDLRDWRAITPVPDLAAELPTTYNAGLSVNHTTYTITLRPNVLWDTTPPRPVTAHDFVRGFKRMCNPVAGAGAIRYFTSTVRGMAEFRDAYAAAIGPDPTAADLAEFQNSNEIAGIRVLDDETLVFELVRPAADFLNILAMPFASAAPAEYDAYLPDSPEFRTDIRSNGPYRLVHYVHGLELRVERNPVWDQATDDVRHQWVDAVEVTMERADPVAVGKKIIAGEADLSWASPVTEPYDANPTDPGNDLGYALNPYLVFNTVGPNNGGALRRPEVRRAIAHAIDKVAIAEIYDKLAAGTVMRPARSAIPPGNDGYEPFDLYATPGDRGDPAKCRALLAEAGYPDGLTLTAVHRDVDANPDVAKSYARDLEQAGITVDLVPMGHADYYAFLQDPANAEAGRWDLTAPSWTPDWFGNNGRAFLQPMFQTNRTRGTSNYGCYSNEEVDRLIELALGETDTGRAHAAWHEVDVQVMRDAAIVPILVHAPTIPHLSGHRVRNAIAMPTIDRWFDLSNVWLEDDEP